MTEANTTAVYDLHLHTCWSYDGLTAPQDYFERARAMGVRCLAVTEHHHTDSFDELRAVADRFPEVRWIPSAELTARTSLGGIDFLCYDLPLEPEGEWAALLDRLRAWQREVGAAMCRGMQRLGFDYTDAHRAEVLRRYRPERVLSRQGETHVKNGVQAAYFVQRGFIRDVSEYRELRARATEAGESPWSGLTGEKLGRAVHAVGGRIAIAHPTGYFAGADRRRMDALREECGLDGIECAHPGIPAQLTPVYRAYCRERGLFSTAGSDTHDLPPAGEPSGFARHIAPPEWLDEFLERLSATPPPRA